MERPCMACVDDERSKRQSKYVGDYPHACHAYMRDGLEHNLVTCCKAILFLYAFDGDFQTNVVESI